MCNDFQCRTVGHCVFGREDCVTRKAYILMHRDRTVGPDQQVWVRQRIETAIRMTLAAVKERKVRADDPLVDGLIEGIARGATKEVLHTLGLKPAVRLFIGGDFISGRLPSPSPGPLGRCSLCGLDRYAQDLTQDKVFGDGRLVCRDDQRCHERARRNRNGGYGP